jgi:hypothetical protein
MIGKKRAMKPGRLTPKADQRDDRLLSAFPLYGMEESVSKKSE